MLDSPGAWKGNGISDQQHHIDSMRGPAGGPIASLPRGEHFSPQSLSAQKRKALLTSAFSAQVFAWVCDYGSP